MFNHLIHIGKWGIFYCPYCWCVGKQKCFGGGVIYRLGPLRITSI